jgi:hypothetical protein
MESPMLKVTLLACAICAAGGTAVWVKSGPSPSHVSAASAAMPTIQELHNKANAAGLPDETVKEAY